MVKVLKRSVALAAAAGIALVGLTATSAEADVIRCSKNTVTGTWRAQCLRYTEDGDPGGVSGNVVLQKVDGGAARVNFSADGEKVWTINTSDKTFWVEVDWWVTPDNIHRDIYYKLLPGDEQDFDRSYPEGRTVQIYIGTTSGKGASTKRLVS
ncbi:hypothetical protein ACFC4G_45270 [Streptomyces sp. NPDC056002]|uniref:hypothetical protein n=1 Tax=Streptomyces sp. NPDC056002 TaxID=3345675 RepID=UPI0035D55FC6